MAWQADFQVHMLQCLLKLVNSKTKKPSQNQSMSRNTPKFLRTLDANSIPVSGSTAYGNRNAKGSQPNRKKLLIDS
jgi:hypothetical protein